VNTFSSSTVRAEASAWIAQLETGDLDPADLDALREWVACSPVHADELRRCARLSGELNVLSEMAGSLTEAAHAHRPMMRKRARRRLAYPAFALCAALTLALAVPLRMSVPEFFTESLATALGEYREHEMPDGSVIALNTHSRLDVLYTPGLRRVSLLAGEALFRVAPDAERPFVVHAGSRRVEAVGTAFVVKLVDEKMEVAVTEGRVKLSSAIPAPTRANSASESVEIRGRRRATQAVNVAAVEAVYLRKGQSLKLPVHREVETAEIESVSAADMRRKLAWREGLLDFHRTPLSQVVAEVSRHSGVHIIIEDPDLRERQFDGLFRVGETQKLLQILDLRDDIDVTQVDAGTVRLSLARQDSN
jgi:transmembrane sensor